LDVHTPFLLPGVASPAMSASTLPSTTAYDAASTVGGGYTNPNMLMPQINPADLQRPESIALILQQQQQIMNLLQRQQSGAGGSSQALSSPTTTNAFPIPHPSTQVYEKGRPPPTSSTRPVLPLPPGAAPARPGSGGTGTPSPLSPHGEDPHADMTATPAPPPAYTAK